MLATLQARSFASLNKKEVFHDEKAESIATQLKFDTSIKNNDDDFIQAIVERVKIFDNAILNLIKENKSINVINLGCGLCTRLERLKDSFNALEINWHNIDTEEVLTIRNSILHEDESIKNLVIKHLDDNHWIKRIVKESTLNLFIMEGFSMYIEKNTFITILKNIINQTKLMNTKTAILFDYYHPNFKEYFLSNKYNVQLETKTGFKNIKEIEQISSDIIINNTYDIFRKLNSFKQLAGRSSFLINNNFEEPYNIVEIKVQNSYI